MSDTAEPSVGDTGAALFDESFNAGDLDACLASLGDGSIAPAERAPFYCRLGEALFYRGRIERALECARAAFDRQLCDEKTANFCAWLFSNCARHSEAATAYERLLERRPHWAAGHRHASGSYAAAGDLDRAVLHALRAAELEPGSFELALHAGSVCAGAGRWQQAFAELARADRIEPENPAVLRQLSAAALALGQPQAALDLAQRAAVLAPNDSGNAIHAAELLLRARRREEAAILLRAALAGDDGNPILWRMLSAAEMLGDRPAAALAAIERALLLAPESVEYHLHCGNLLHRLGRFEEAGAAFGRAAALDPANAAARRSQLTAYFDAGRLHEALAVGGELIRSAPENDEYARAVLQVLNRRCAIDGLAVVLGEETSPRRRRPRPPRRWIDALRTQGRVIHALIIRESRTRFGDSMLGYGWALIEPILHILTLTLAFAVLFRGRPPIGNQFFIFYYTGLIPYHVFVHASSSMTFAVTSNGSLLQLPLVTTFDVILARGLLELATDLIVATLMMAGFLAIGIGRLPENFAGVALAVAVVWLLACGLGFVNAVITAFFKSWDKIWTQVTRILYFVSGIFYVPGMMPDWVRHILVWNPLLHGIDWFRSSFFAEYEPHWLDRTYLASTATLALLMGLALERGLRRQLYEPL